MRGRCCHGLTAALLPTTHLQAQARTAPRAARLPAACRRRRRRAAASSHRARPPRRLQRWRRAQRATCCTPPPFQGWVACWPVGQQGFNAMQGPEGVGTWTEQQLAWPLRHCIHSSSATPHARPQVLACLMRHFRASLASLPLLAQPVSALPIGTWAPTSSLAAQIAAEGGGGGADDEQQQQVGGQAGQGCGGGRQQECRLAAHAADGPGPTAAALPAPPACPRRAASASGRGARGAWRPWPACPPTRRSRRRWGCCWRRGCRACQWWTRQVGGREEEGGVH